MITNSAEKEETVKEFISRNLGEEVYYRLIDPFCSGVYAGDPAKLSMKAAFGRVGSNDCCTTEF
jgi:oxygen-dependent protoporphyrinogen oxidase